MFTLDKIHSTNNIFTPTISAQMATLILVQCKTEDMPGEYSQKSLLMANIACQAVWNQDFNSNLPEYDRLTTYGGWMNPQCVLLIDNGAVDEKYTFVHRRWHKKQLYVLDNICFCFY